MKTTKALHTDSKGAYTPEREILHRQIIDRAMAGTQPQGAPQAIFTASPQDGDSLSGRGPLGTNLIVPRNHVWVSPMAIMKQLPEYVDGEVAAKGCSAEVSDIAKVMCAAAIKGKRHMVIEGTGKSSHFADHLHAVKGYGYHPIARFSTSSGGEAWQQVKRAPGITAEAYSMAGRGRPTLVAHKPERGSLSVKNSTAYQGMS